MLTRAAVVVSISLGAIKLIIGKLASIYTAVMIQSAIGIVFYFVINSTVERKFGASARTRNSS